MVGQQALFTTIFPSKIEKDASRRGVCNIGTTRRDEALTYRYYYYIEIKRIRYDDVLVLLERDFYITPSNVVLRLTLLHEFLKGIIDKKPTVNKLKKMFPTYAW